MVMSLEFLNCDCGSIIGSMLEACFGLCTGVPSEFVGGGLGEFFLSFAEMIWSLLGF